MYTCGVGASEPWDSLENATPIAQAPFAQLVQFAMNFHFVTSGNVRKISHLQTTRFSHILRASHWMRSL